LLIAIIKMGDFDESLSLLAEVIMENNCTAAGISAYQQRRAKREGEIFVQYHFSRV
jgi:hypothetical protein